KLIAPRLPPQREDLRIVGRSFDAEIRTVVLIGAVAIVLAVCLVVLQLVADEIREGEPVMNGDVVDARARCAAIMIEQIGGAGHAAPEFADEIAFAGPITAQRAAEAIVPFRPARGKAADPIAAEPEVPWFGDQFDPRQNRVLAHRREEARATIKSIGPAPER